MKIKDVLKEETPTPELSPVLSGIDQEKASSKTEPLIYDAVYFDGDTKQQELITCSVIMGLSPEQYGHYLHKREKGECREKTKTLTETIAQYKQWFEKKGNAKDYKKLSRLFLEFSVQPIRLTKQLLTPPMGKRGDKGFLLDDMASSLLEPNAKAAFRKRKENYDISLVYVNGGVIGLPKESYRLLKKKT